MFNGDITYEEAEISWIVQSDISPVLKAYPDLEVLQVRGGENLQFSSIVYEKLKALIVQMGGLTRRAIAQICDNYPLWSIRNYG